MTDFSPLEGALMDGSGPLAPVERLVRGSSGFGSDDGLRVNMKSPKLQMKNAPSAIAAQAQMPRHDVSSSSSSRSHQPSDSSQATISGGNGSHPMSMPAQLGC